MGFLWVSELQENEAVIMKWLSLQKQFLLAKTGGRF